MNRPTWDEAWASLARDIAQRSRCDRAKIGSVIVDRTQRVLAVAYNGPPAGYAPANSQPESRCTDWCARAKWGPSETTAISYSDCPANHSEINALLATDRTQREGGTVFVTGSLCLTCAKAVANSGLARVVVVDGAGDGSDAHRVPQQSLQYLDRCGIEVEHLTTGRTPS